MTLAPRRIGVPTLPATFTTGPGSRGHLAPRHVGIPALPRLAWLHLHDRILARTLAAEPRFFHRCTPHRAPTHELTDRRPATARALAGPLSHDRIPAHALGVLAPAPALAAAPRPFRRRAPHPAPARAVASRPTTGRAPARTELLSHDRSSTSVVPAPARALAVLATSPTSDARRLP